MKSTFFKLPGFVFLSLLIWSCSKSVNDPTSQATLKQAVTQSSQNLNVAVDNIVSSQAYQVFTSGESTMKSGTIAASGTSYKVYILLDSIKGVYDYKPVIRKDHMGFSLIKYFTKSANSSKMVVNMPLSKVKNPHTLRDYNANDSTLANNFSISVSDYHNNYNSYHDFDYQLVSQISIDSKKAGDLSILSNVSPTLGTHYSSQYIFSDSYTAKYQYTSGDTIVSSFSILKSNNVLYEEKLLSIKKDTAQFGREHQYILTIGNVKIVRKSASAAEVYVDGVLQPKAVVTILDTDNDEDSEHSICKKREIQITFEDGTTATISSLIGKSIDNITTLYTSLHQVYFAAYVVDWIAYDIYYKRN